MVLVWVLASFRCVGSGMGGGLVQDGSGDFDAGFRVVPIVVSRQGSNLIPHRGLLLNLLFGCPCSAGNTKHVFWMFQSLHVSAILLHETIQAVAHSGPVKH